MTTSPFADYVEKLRLLEAQVKLVSFHTLEAARQAEKAAEYALQTAYHVREYLSKRRIR